MRDAGELRRALADYLRANGVEAVTAWGEERRPRPGRAVAAVSLRGMESGAPGYQDYLGERYDEQAGAWEELYGKRLELTFGVDVYGATAEEVCSGVDGLSAALGRGGPAGMKPVGFSAGETCYKEEARRYFCPAEVRFQVWAVAAAREDGSFLDFEVRGESGK